MWPFLWCGWNFSTTCARTSNKNLRCVRTCLYVAVYVNLVLVESRQSKCCLRAIKRLALRVFSRHRFILTQVYIRIYNTFVYLYTPDVHICVTICNDLCCTSRLDNNYYLVFFEKESRVSSSWQMPVFIRAGERFAASSKLDGRRSNAFIRRSPRNTIQLYSNAIQIKQLYTHVNMGAITKTDKN